MRSTDNTFLVANLNYRIKQYHPQADIQIGTGNPNGKVLVVQPHTNMPERDAITGALKKFGLLHETYRATSKVIDFYLSPKRIDKDHVDVEYPSLLKHGKVTQPEFNRRYLKELIQIIRPLMVIVCGEESMSLLREKQVRGFHKYGGKKFRVTDMPDIIFYATLNPVEYGFARASEHLKTQGKQEWTALEIAFRDLEEKHKKTRWT